MKRGQTQDRPDAPRGQRRFLRFGPQTATHFARLPAFLRGRALEARTGPNRPDRLRGRRRFLRSRRSDDPDAWPARRRSFGDGRLKRGQTPTALIGFAVGGGFCVPVARTTRTPGPPVGVPSGTGARSADRPQTALTDFAVGGGFCVPVVRMTRTPDPPVGVPSGTGARSADRPQPPNRPDRLRGRRQFLRSRRSDDPDAWPACVPAWTGHLKCAQTQNRPDRLRGQRRFLRPRLPDGPGALPARVPAWAGH